MLAQREEIQVIPVQRNNVYRMEEKAERYKRRESRRRKRVRINIMKMGLIVFAILCFVTNWFTEIPFISEKVESLRIEQLKQDASYPAELLELVEKNEETYEFVKDYPNREKYLNQKIDLSKECKSDKVPLLMQWDKRWGYEMYGDSMVALSGCGPTCMTMAYLHFKDDASMYPAKMANYAQEQGFHSEEGTSWNFWTDGALDLGLYGEEVSLDEDVMKAVIDAGGVIVCSMRPGDFTDGGHYILIRNYNEDGFFINDPNSKKNSKKQWEYKDIHSQIKNLWGIYGE